MKAELVTITPQLASEMLTKNTFNRPINQARVLYYASIIGKDEWIINGESIKFDTDGNLIDGQHRLHAIVKSQKPIQTLVIHGLEKWSFKTIDTGKTRTAGDILSIDGIKNSTAIAAGIATYFTLLQGKKSIEHGSITIKVSPSDVLKEYKEHSTLYQELFLTSQRFYVKNHRILTRSEYVGFYRFFQSKYSQETINTFFNNIEDGIGVCGLLRSRLLDNLVSKRKITGMEKTALIIKAFNHFISGKELKQFKYLKGEKFPTI